MGFSSGPPVFPAISRGCYESDLLNALHFAERAKSQSDAKAWEELTVGRRYIYVIIVPKASMKTILRMYCNRCLLSFGSTFRIISTILKSKVSFLWQPLRVIKLSALFAASSHMLKIDKAQQESQESYLNSINTPEVEEIATKEWELFLSNTALDNVAKHFSPKALEAFELFAKGMKVNDISQKLEVKADSVYKYISRIKVKLVEEIQNLKRELDF